MRLQPCLYLSCCFPLKCSMQPILFVFCCFPCSNLQGKGSLHLLKFPETSMQPLSRSCPNPQAFSPKQQKIGASPRADLVPYLTAVCKEASCSRCCWCRMFRSVKNGCSAFLQSTSSLSEQLSKRNPTSGWQVKEQLWGSRKALELPSQPWWLLHPERLSHALVSSCSPHSTR